MIPMPVGDTVQNLKLLIPYSSHLWPLERLQYDPDASGWRLDEKADTFQNLNFNNFLSTLKILINNVSILLYMRGIGKLPVQGWTTSGLVK